MRGMTLIELVVVLVLVFIAAGLAVPRAGEMRDRLLVEHATSEIMAAYGRARLEALRSGGRVLLRAASDSIRLWELQGVDSAMIWGADGPTVAGVQLVSSIPRIVFGPNGATMGVANGRFTLKRGSIRRGLIASRLGRLRVDRNP